MSFICEQKWDDLAETDKDGLRHCGRCNTDVHWCNSLKELRTAEGKKWCVAFDGREFTQKNMPNGLLTGLAAPSIDSPFFKKTWVRISSKKSITKVTAEIENEWYAIALSEIEDEDYKKGLWSKALISSDGDEHKQKVAYIKLRVEQLGASYNLDFDD